MIEFLSCRPNLEVADLPTAAAFLRDVLGFEVEVDEPEMGLMLLRRDAVGLALVRSASPGVNATTALYVGVTDTAACGSRRVRRDFSVLTSPWERTDRQTATVPSSKSMCSHRSARASSVRIPVVKDSTTYALVR